MLRLRTALVAAAIALALGATASALAHDFDHPAPAASLNAPIGTELNSSPPGQWELLTTFPTGNPHTDLDFFEQDGEIYASVGTLAAGPNGGGQSIVRLTQDGQINRLTPRFITGHPSAECTSNPLDALGLQHDVEATPKGDVIFNTHVPGASRRDAQLLLDASDAQGRCHDQGPLGGLSGSPQGGVEIIDITTLDAVDEALEPVLCPATATLPSSSELRCAVEIALTSHIGEAHTVNVDPRRPHIAYAVTSDAVGVTRGTDGSYQRRNEVHGSDQNDLDGFELIDLSSCLDFPRGTTVAVKRLLCQPVVYRYRFPTATAALGHTRDDAIYGCHELEVYPNDLLTCGSGAALLAFDMSGAFDDNGTPGDYTDDRPRGEPLPCNLRPSSSAITPTGAKVTDCVVGEGGQDLSVPGWLGIGAPSLEGVEYLGSIYHQGRGGPYDSNDDIDFDHEAELSASGRLLLATDERGGGVSPPGASCAPGLNDVPPFNVGNGGIHAYRFDALSTERPATAEEAWEAYARTSTGAKAIYRAPVHTQPQGTLCTAHVFHQIPGQNRIFMGWYTQGTQVVDFIEREDGRVDFVKVGHFIPESANTWVSAIFKVERNDDGSYTYYGATGDFNLGVAGRSAIDVYRVTLPTPPRPLGGGGDGDGGGGGGDDDDDDDGDGGGGDDDGGDDDDDNDSD